MKKKINIKKDLYLCCPLLHKECKKDDCYIHNGGCRLTIHKEYSQQELIDRIDKAIEYIEQLEEIETYYPALTYRTYQIESKNDIVGDLLDILKGEEDE